MYKQLKLISSCPRSTFRAALALLATLLLAGSGCAHHRAPVTNSLPADMPLTKAPLQDNDLLPTSPPPASAPSADPHEYHVVDAATAGFTLTLDYHRLGGDGQGHIESGEVANLKIGGLPIPLASGQITDSKVRTILFGDFLLSGDPPRIKINMTDSQIKAIRAYVKSHAAPLAP